MPFSQVFKSKLSNWEEKRAISQFEQKINGSEKDKNEVVEEKYLEKKPDTLLLELVEEEVIQVIKEEEYNIEKQVVHADQEDIEEHYFSEAEDSSEEIVEQEVDSEEAIDTPSETSNEEVSLEVTNPDFSEITLNSRFIKAESWESKVKSNEVFKDDFLEGLTEKNQELDKQSLENKNQNQEESNLFNKKVEDDEQLEFTSQRPITLKQSGDDKSEEPDLLNISKNYLTGGVVPKEKSESEEKEIEFINKSSKDDEVLVELENKKPKSIDLQFEQGSIIPPIGKSEELKPFERKEKDSEEENLLELAPIKEQEEIISSKKASLTSEEVDNKLQEKQPKLRSEPISKEEQSNLEYPKIKLDEKIVRPEPFSKKNEEIPPLNQLKAYQIKKEETPVSSIKNLENTVEDKKNDVKPKLRFKLKKEIEVPDEYLEQKPKVQGKKETLVPFNDSQSDNLNTPKASFENSLEKLRKKPNTQNESVDDVAKKDSPQEHKEDLNDLFEKPKNIPKGMFEMFKELDNKIKSNQEKKVNKEDDA